MRRLAIILILALLNACSQPNGPCQLVSVADLPVTFLNNLPTIQLDIDRHVLRMLVDTGSFGSVITPSAEKELGNSYIYGEVANLSGINGVVTAGIIVVRRYQLGGIRVENQPFFVIDLNNPNARMDRRIDGAIGEDILHAHNIALDLPHNRITLYQKNQCAAAFPWAGQFASMKFTNTLSNTPAIEIYLDNHPFSALIDTGSGASLLNSDAIRAGGIVPAATSGKVTNYGIGALAGTETSGRFARLAIGGEMFANSWFLMTGPGLDEKFDVLIGENYLRTHQVFISNDTNTIWLGTKMPPNGS